MQRTIRLAVAVCLLFLASCNGESTPRSAKGTSAETSASSTNGVTSNNASLTIFQQRILPIFQAKKPSSCTECHLSGVDLKDYIDPSQEKTFASLVASGLVEVDDPDDSKILRLINMRPEKPNLITDKVRQQEYEAFRAWIRAAVKDRDLLAAKSDKLLGPLVPDEVIRHARNDRVLASFIDNIWGEVGRCAACHSPDRNQKQVKKFGDRVSWIVLRDPKATMEYMAEQGLFNSSAPEKSQLLTKPTMQVEHKGGKKMEVGDRTYKQFRRFIDDFAAIRNNQYKTAEQLPTPSDEISVATDIWLKITGVPARFDKMLLRADVYRQEGNGWSKTRWASGDRAVFGKGQLWRQSLSVMAPRGSERAKDARLPGGTYLVRIYLDRTGKLEKDYQAELDETDFVGQVEVNSSWPSGYGRMTAVRFPVRD